MYFCSRCSLNEKYKFIISLLAKRALHVCRTANASLCASNASRRIYPALHGLPTANHTSPTPFEKSEVFCRSACPAIARRATADCRGIVYSNSNAIIGKILSLLNGNRAFSKKARYGCSSLSRHSHWRRRMVALLSLITYPYWGQNKKNGTLIRAPHFFRIP